MLYVVMGRNLAQKRRWKSPILFVILNQAIVFKNGSSCVDQVDSAFQKLRILFKFVQWNRVMFGIFEHSDVQVSVRQPINSVSKIVNSAEDNFGIKLVWKRFEHLTL